VYESRFAAGPLARRHVPGNLRETADQPLDNLIVRRKAALESGAFDDAAARRNDGDVCRRLAERGTVLFTPDAPVVVEMSTLILPLVQTLHAHGRARGRALRTGQGAPRSAAAPTAFALLLLPLAPALPKALRRLLGASALAYAGGLTGAAVLAATRHRSSEVGGAFVLAAPASHLAYGAGILRGALHPHEDEPRAEIEHETEPRPSA
jgi:hypothetical protein